MAEKNAKRNIRLITVILVLALLTAGTVIVMALLGVFNNGSGGGNEVVACQTDKLTFDQSSACMNDGSVEFCIPADDPEALQRVKDITGDGQCGPGRGRVGCGDGELLCMYFVRPHCESRDATITQAGWNTICAVSELPFVDSITATWYE